MLSIQILLTKDQLSTKSLNLFNNNNIKNHPHTYTSSWLKSHGELCKTLHKSHNERRDSKYFTQHKPQKVLPSGFPSNPFLHFCLLEFAFFPDSYTKSLEIIRIELHLSSILPKIAYTELEENFKWAQFQVGLLSFWPIILMITFSMKSTKV